MTHMTEVQNYVSSPKCLCEFLWYCPPLLTLYCTVALYAFTVHSEVRKKLNNWRKEKWGGEISSWINLLSGCKQIFGIFSIWGREGGAHLYLSQHLTFNNILLTLWVSSSFMCIILCIINLHLKLMEFCV